MHVVNSIPHKADRRTDGPLLSLSRCWTRLRVAALGAVICASTAPLVAQQAGEPVLDHEGTIYRALVGAESELFRVGTGYGEGKLLALDVTEAGVTDRLVVPGSRGALDATIPQLVVLPNDASIYVLWESRVSWLHSQFNLLSYSKQYGFSAITDISGRPFGRKLQPVVVPHGDRYSESDSDRRTFVQVFWRDEEGTVFYYPLARSASNADVDPRLSYDLTKLFDIPAADITSAGYDLHAVRSQHRGGSWIVRMDRTDGRIDLLQAYIVPGPLSEMAEGIYEAILARGSSMQATLEDLRGDARATIVNIGRAINPALADLLEAEVDGRLSLMQETFDRGDIEGIAGDARANIVNVGARVDRAGVSVMSDGADEIPWSLIRLEEAITDGVRIHHTLMSHHAILDSPRDVLSEEAQVLVSRDGERVAVYVENFEGALYSLWQNGAWGEPMLLDNGALGDSVTARELILRLINH